jgi:hypothetical protein
MDRVMAHGQLLRLVVCIILFYSVNGSCEFLMCDLLQEPIKTDQNKDFYVRPHSYSSIQSQMTLFSCLEEARFFI